MTEDQNSELDASRKDRSPGVFDEAFLTDAPDVTELLLIRHARQEWNPEGTMGEMADPPLSYQEISARLGIPIGSIGPTRARCIGVLRRRTEAQVAA